MPPRKVSQDTLDLNPELDSDIIAEAIAPKKRNKNNAVKTVVDGITFDSRLESRRYSELKLTEASGEITKLKLQEKLTIRINGIKVCVYKPDFTYELDGKRIIEDVKSDFTRRNPVYRLKKKLLWAAYGLEILETGGRNDKRKK